METLLALIQQYGLAFVFVNVLLLQAGLPVPAYPTLIITGALAARGGAPVPALVGDRDRRGADRRPRLVPRRPPFRQRRASRRSAASRCRPTRACARPSRSSRAGARARLRSPSSSPGFASVATSMAGVVRLPVWKFVLFDAIGAALWSGVAIGLGYAFSGAINQVLAVFETLGKIGLWIIAGAFLLYVAAKWWQRELFIWQLRMDRLTVDELSRAHEGQPRRQGDRRALADVAGDDGPHPGRDHGRSQEHPCRSSRGRAGERGHRLLRSARTSTRRPRSRKCSCSTASSACGRCSAASTRGSRRGTRWKRSKSAVLK